jgi:hypothetical protein
MYNVIPYTRPDGEQPVREWIDAQDNSIKPNIHRKVDDLRKNGPALLNTNSMDIISGPDNGFYELRNRALGWRIAVYYNLKRDIFVLLHGWHKDKNYKREIQRARDLLHEYLKGETKSYGG